MALSKADQTLRALRHSAVALLGAALRDLFPAVQLIGGRSTSLGFVYDIAGLIPGDVTMLTLVEERMRAIASSGISIKSREMVRENAAEYFRYHNQIFKAEALADYPEGIVSLLQIGDFLDLAPLPHVTSLNEIKALCLLSSSTSQRRFQSGEEMAVTSIAGTVQRDQKDLKAFVKIMKDRRDTDHRLLGRELELFILDQDEKVCLWTPKGTVLRNHLLQCCRDEFEGLGYEWVTTTDLDPESDRRLQSKARHHALLYKSERNGSQLPVGYAEAGTVWETSKCLEPEGVLSQPVYTCPEGHLFCAAHEAPMQLQRHLQCLQHMLSRFHLEAHAYLTAGHVGPSEMRKRATDWLEESLQAEQMPFEKDEEDIDAEGPCIHLRIVDRMGRAWKGPSLGINLVQPTALGLQSVMVSMRPVGSLERWIGLILEQSKGNLPFWLAPEQVRLLPVSPAHHGYTETVRLAAQAAGMRIGVDRGDERLGAKIYAFERARVPFALILGNEEQAQQTVTVRRRGDRSNGESLTLHAFLAMVSAVHHE